MIGNECIHALNCEQIASELRNKRIIGSGGVKDIYRAQWKGHDVVLAQAKVVEDFDTGVALQQRIASSGPLVPVLGYCADTHQAVYPYFSRGSADAYAAMPHLTLKERLNILTDVAEAVAYLHCSPAGTRVLCDSNDPSKLLSQFLVDANGRLWLNDIDAAPLVDKSTGIRVRCGHRQLPQSPFVAPEQLWPYADKPFVDEEMPGYDEKTDIWKLGALASHLLDCRLATEQQSIQPCLLGPRGQIHLQRFQFQCGQKQPELRPAAGVALLDLRKLSAVALSERDGVSTRVDPP